MDIIEAKQYLSQGIGYQIGNQIANDPNLDNQLIIDTILAVIDGKAEAPDQAKFQQAAQIVQEEASKSLREAGDAFLAENKQKEGVITTDSGLQYKVLKQGSGDKPKADQQVTVHYEGQLIDGTIFDSSKKRGQPAKFGVHQVIKGWVEGLQLMQPGAVYRFVIPQDLAYGPQGSPGSIPPYATLVFEVELLEIH